MILIPLDLFIIFIFFYNFIYLFIHLYIILTHILFIYQTVDVLEESLVWVDIILLYCLPTRFTHEK